MNSQCHNKSFTLKNVNHLLMQQLLDISLLKAESPETNKTKQFIHATVVIPKHWSVGSLRQFNLEEGVQLL